VQPSSYLRFAVFLVVAFTASQLIETKRRSEEALRTIQARLSRATRFATVAELAASIAHEVSQPLSAVVANGQACIQWLSARPPNVTNAQVAAERIVRDGKDAGDEVVRHMRALFKRLLSTKSTWISMTSSLKCFALLIRRRFRSESLSKPIWKGDFPQCRGDRVQLQQVIFNLVLNGIEAMEDVTDRPKELLICSKLQKSDAIVVEIRDYGTGLADSEKIYDAFYTTKEKGMGMGLSICRSIVEAHGGRLGTVPSQGPGTTFFFTLPLRANVPA